MARDGYIKQVWEDGVSPVNAERLNEMERGIELGVNLAWNAIDNAGGSGGNEPYVITLGASSSGIGLPVDKPFEEIMAQIEAGNLTNMYMVFHKDENNTMYFRPSMLTPNQGVDAIVFSTIAVDDYGQIEILIAGVMPNPQKPGETVAAMMGHTLVNA